MPAKRIDPGGAHQHVVSTGPRSLLVCTATRLVAQANCPVAAAADTGRRAADHDFSQLTNRLTVSSYVQLGRIQWELSRANPTTVGARNHRVGSEE